MRRESGASLTTAAAMPTASMPCAAAGARTWVLATGDFSAFASTCARIDWIARMRSSSDRNCSSSFGSRTASAPAANRSFA
jgi:hypothetical protein